MRVAYVCADPGVPVFGRKGCSVHVQEVIRAMLGQGSRVTLIAQSPGGEPPADLRRVEVHRLDELPKGDPAGRELAALAANHQIKTCLDIAGPFDMVYERYSLWSHAAMGWAGDRGTPGVLEVNAPLIEEQAKYRGLIHRDAAKAVAERVFSCAELLVAVSEQVAAYLESFSGTIGRVRVMPNGVNPSRFHEEIKPTLQRDPGAFTIGFLGTLKPWHGLEILVESFALVYLADPTVRLLIVGDGPQRRTMMDRLSDLNLLGAVRFTGAVEPSEVPGLLASMDVGVAPYPGADDCYFSPLKVLEYMAAGLPVVASRVGQLTELIEDGVSGLLCSPDCPSSLASALQRLRHDVEARTTLGRFARLAVKRRHTWEQNIRRVFDSVGVEPAPKVVI